MVSKRKQQLYFIELFGLWAGAEEKWFRCFRFLIHFVDRALRDLFVEAGIFWYGCILFCSAISCGSELIVGAFVQKVQQTSCSDTRYIQDVSWMAVSHVSMCDEMSMRHRRQYPESKGVVRDFFLTVILRAFWLLASWSNPGTWCGNVESHVWTWWHIRWCVWRDLNVPSWD